MGRVVAVVAVVLAAGCPAAFPKYDYAKELDPRGKELVLGAGDTIAINVWENSNLNTEATIRPDGKITMSLVGDVKAAGETPTSLKAQIKTQLANFVKLQSGNEITVVVKAWRSYRFTIQGEVSRTGVFSSDQYVTVADALASVTRLDSVLLESYMHKHDRFHVLAGLESFTDGDPFDATAVSQLLEVVTQTYTHAVVDLPPSVPSQTESNFGRSTPGTRRAPRCGSCPRRGAAKPAARRCPCGR
jgi:hypothetical protein